MISPAAQANDSVAQDNKHQGSGIVDVSDGDWDICSAVWRHTLRPTLRQPEWSVAGVWGYLAILQINRRYRTVRGMTKTWLPLVGRFAVRSGGGEHICGQVGFDDLPGHFG